MKEFCSIYLEYIFCVKGNMVKSACGWNMLPAAFSVGIFYHFLLTKAFKLQTETRQNLNIRILRIAQSEAFLEIWAKCKKIKIFENVKKSLMRRKRFLWMQWVEDDATVQSKVNPIALLNSIFVY